MIAGINQPWKIVNTFGGQMTALAHQLSYIKPSVFLFRHPILTKRLIFFSRLHKGLNGLNWMKNSLNWRSPMGILSLQLRLLVFRSKW